jgi:hypothetical protein
MIKSIKNTATSKLPEAFLPDYVNVDDRSTDNLLQEFTEYARQIPFIDEYHQQLGNWDEMYTEQILFLLIDISCLDIDLLERRKRKATALWLIDGESKAMTLLHDVLDILKKLYDKAKRLHTPWISEEISALIGNSLFENVEHLKKELTKSGKKDELENLHKWHDWLFYEKQDMDSRDQIGKSPKSVFKYTINAINDSINCLYALNRKLTTQKFDKMLEDGQHPGHIGLLYGFLKSYEMIQKRFNHLPKRHLDYYFKTILRQEALAAQPDFAYLFIKLVPMASFLELKNETAFVAGQDKNGNDIIFETTQPYNLSSAKISDLITLLYDKSDSILPLNKAKMITGIYMDSVKPLLFTGNNNENWPLCGEPSDKQLPETGWAISSSDFFLTSGVRRIKLSFELTDTSASLFDSLLLEITGSEIESSGFKKKEAIHRFFNNAFDLRISSAAGMLTVENYVVNLSQKNNKKAIDFQFTLSTRIPAWIPYNENVHGPEFKTSLPLLCFKLKQESVYYPYSLIALLEIETLKIAVSVSNLQNLILYNKHGIVNSANPFPLLGMNPLQGNSLYIGAKEWQFKKLKSVDLIIHWLDLPNPNFKDYYKNYKTQSITDGCFTISIDDHTSNIPLGPLFVTDKDDRLTDGSSFLNIKIDKVPDLNEIIPADYFSPATVPLSFISIKLDTPDAGFGSEIYPAEMALYGQELIANIKKKTVSVPPQKPFVPMAKSIVINYRSKSQISFHNSSKTIQRQSFEFFHIHPFGIEKVGDDKKINSKKLLPEFEAEGNLYIGLEGTVPLTELSIFMKLIPSDIALKKEVTTIHYLSGKYWKIIPPENILENSTNHCQETGVIRIILPADLLSDHLFLDTKKNWLKISFESSDLNALGRCVYINTNVITVLRKIMHPHPAFTVLEPLSISGLYNKNNSIQSMTQPFQSFGGRKKENEKDFYSRISNRLGHKNRMVRERDYRRMILEKFPEINWIKVLTPSKYPNTIHPGELKLIVMPKISDSDDFSTYFASKLTRQSIKKYVVQHCAPGLTVCVESPDYEIIEVRCSVMVTTNVLTTFKKEISEIISKQVAPWLYHNEIHYEKVSTKFSVGNLIHQINQHPNVKNVCGCQVIRISKDKTRYTYFDSVTDGEIIMPSSEKSVLIPANNFEINQITDEEITERKLSIGTMNIGDNLILKNKTEVKENESISLTDGNQEFKKTYFISLKI